MASKACIAGTYVSDLFQASYRSLTKATSQDLYVSTEYLNPGDRVLLVDDFLAGGATADAMVRLCRMANAKVGTSGAQLNVWPCPFVAGAKWYPALHVQP